jgi:sugar lactone lactonase YvrE
MEIGVIGDKVRTVLSWARVVKAFEATTRRARTHPLAFLAILVVAGGGCGTADDDGPRDEAEGASALVRFDGAAREFPEGVTVDARGNVYASISPLGRLVRIAAGSDTAEPVGAVEGLADGDLGLLGLTIGADGDVYGAVAAGSRDVGGVWRFDSQTGEAERVPGTQEIALPNSVVFDRSTMYVTDTIGPDGGGAVWRVPEGGEAELWAQSELLAGDGSAGFGIPLGPNGIDVHDDAVFVGLTEPASIAIIPISDDGRAGDVSIFADLTTAGPDGSPIAVDGIDVNDEGTIYVAAPILHSIYAVSAEGTDVETFATADDGLDAPASVALGDDVLYVSSFSAALGDVSNGNGPAIIRVPL